MVLLPVDPDRRSGICSLPAAGPSCPAKTAVAAVGTNHITLQGVLITVKPAIDGSNPTVQQETAEIRSIYGQAGCREVDQSIDLSTTSLMDFLCDHCQRP